MSTTITGKLNKAANQFQAGESTGFGIRLGVKYRDPKTKQDEWTNYQAVIFAKAPGQVKFYQDVLIEGSVIEVSCEQLKIDSFDGTNTTATTSATATVSTTTTASAATVPASATTTATISTAKRPAYEPATGSAATAS